MRRTGTLVLAALMLGAPVSAPAQPANTQTPQIPPDALVPNDEARAFFETLASHVLTDEMLAAMIQTLPGGSAAPMDDVIEPFFARGEQVPGWNASGLDVEAIIAERAGGTAGNMLRGATGSGFVYTYLSDRPFDEVVPRAWVLVGRRGAPVAGDDIDVVIGRISPKVILAERVSYRRLGHAFCRATAESRLYADPNVPASEMDTIAVIIAMRQLQRMERSRICDVIEEAGPGRFRARTFDAEGYRLPAFDRESPTMEIVPVAPPQ